MNEQKNKKSIIIIGGGAGGLYAAWRLSQEGYKITIIERQNFLGGLGTSIKKNNCFMDIGPHYISLNKNSRIFDDVFHLLGKDGVRELPSLENFFKSFHQNQILDNTPKLSRVMKNDKISLFKKLIQNIFLKNNFDKVSSKEYLISLYGESVYNSLCKPVLMQTYGEIPPLEIIKKLYEPISIKKIIKYFKKNQKQSEGKNSNFKSSTFNCYFKNGMGSIIDNFEKQINESDGKIILGANIESIEHGKSKLVRYTKDDQVFTKSSDIILYSIPLSFVIKWFDNHSINTNQELTTSKISNGILVYVLVDTPKIFDGWLLDVYDLSIPFFRIAQQTFLSSNVAPKNKTLLCLEMRAKDNDEFWKLDDKTLFSAASKSLHQIFNLDNKKIDELFVLKLKNLYRPQYYKIKSQDNEIIKYINSFSNEFALGTTTFSDTGDNPTRLSHDDDTSSFENNEPIAYGGFYNSLFRSNQIVEKILLNDA